MMMLQGHFVMHLAMFLGSFFVNTDYSKLIKAMNEENLKGLEPGIG